MTPESTNNKWKNLKQAMTDPDKTGQTRETKHLKYSNSWTKGETSKITTILYKNSKSN